MFPEPGTIPVNEFDELQVAPLSKEYSHEQPEGDDEIAGEVIVAVYVDPEHTALVDVIVGISCIYT